MSRRVVASLLVFLLAGVSLPGHVAPLGVVTEAANARLSAAAVSAGATVYDGDRLATDAQGALRLRSGAALLYLPGQSGVTLHSAAAGTQASLTAGTLVFSAAKAAAMEIHADEARIRPAKDEPTVAQVTMVGPKELRVFARRGALAFSYREETEMIPEGASYRVILDPPDTAETPAQRGPVSGPRKPGKYNKAFFFVIFGAVGATTVWAVHEAWESPDKP
jgi:hypothetical protein